MSKLNTVRQRVIEILETTPATRNCDKLLIAHYLRYHHSIHTFMQHAEDHTAPTTESIRRMRQKIQNEEGLYPSDEATRKARQKEEELYRENARTKFDDTTGQGSLL